MFSFVFKGSMHSIFKNSISFPFDTKMKLEITNNLFTDWLRFKGRSERKLLLNHVWRQLRTKFSKIDAQIVFYNLISSCKVVVKKPLEHLNLGTSRINATLSNETTTMGNCREEDELLTDTSLKVDRDSEVTHESYVDKSIKLNLKDIQKVEFGNNSKINQPEKNSIDKSFKNETNSQDGLRNKISTSKINSLSLEKILPSEERTPFSLKRKKKKEKRALPNKYTKTEQQSVIEHVNSDTFDEHEVVVVRPSSTSMKPEIFNDINEEKPKTQDYFSLNDNNTSLKSHENIEKNNLVSKKKLFNISKQCKFLSKVKINEINVLGTENISEIFYNKDTESVHKTPHSEELENEQNSFLNVLDQVPVNKNVKSEKKDSLSLNQLINKSVDCKDSTFLKTSTEINVKKKVRISSKLKKQVKQNYKKVQLSKKVEDSKWKTKRQKFILQKKPSDTCQEDGQDNSPIQESIQLGGEMQITESSKNQITDAAKSNKEIPNEHLSCDTLNIDFIEQSKNTGEDQCLETDCSSVESPKSLTNSNSKKVKKILELDILTKTGIMGRKVDCLSDKDSASTNQELPNIVNSTPLNDIMTETNSLKTCSGSKVYIPLNKHVEDCDKKECFSSEKIDPVNFNKKVSLFIEEKLKIKKSLSLSNHNKLFDEQVQQFQSQPEICNNVETGNSEQINFKKRSISDSLKNESGSNLIGESSLQNKSSIQLEAKNVPSSYNSSCDGLLSRLLNEGLTFHVPKEVMQSNITKLHKILEQSSLNTLNNSTLYCTESKVDSNKDVVQTKQGKTSDAAILSISDLQMVSDNQFSLSKNTIVILPSKKKATSSTLNYLSADANFSEQEFSAKENHQLKSVFNSVNANKLEKTNTASDSVSNPGKIDNILQVNQTVDTSKESERTCCHEAQEVISPSALQNKNILTLTQSKPSNKFNPTQVQMNKTELILKKCELEETSFITDVSGVNNIKQQTLVYKGQIRERSEEEKPLPSNSNDRKSFVPRTESSKDKNSQIFSSDVQSIVLAKSAISTLPRRQCGTPVKFVDGELLEKCPKKDTSLTGSVKGNLSSVYDNQGPACTNKTTIVYYDPTTQFQSSDPTKLTISSVPYNKPVAHIKTVLSKQSQNSMANNDQSTNSKKLTVLTNQPDETTTVPIRNFPQYAMANSFRNDTTKKYNISTVPTNQSSTCTGTPMHKLPQYPLTNNTQPTDSLVGLPIISTALSQPGTSIKTTTKLPQNHVGNTAQPANAQFGGYKSIVLNTLNVFLNVFIKPLQSDKESKLIPKELLQAAVKFLEVKKPCGRHRSEKDILYIVLMLYINKFNESVEEKVTKAAEILHLSIYDHYQYQQRLKKLPSLILVSEDLRKEEEKRARMQYEEMLALRCPALGKVFASVMEELGDGAVVLVMPFYIRVTQELVKFDVENADYVLSARMRFLSLSKYFPGISPAIMYWFRLSEEQFQKNYIFTKNLIVTLYLTGYKREENLNEFIQFSKLKPCSPLLFNFLSILIKKKGDATCSLTTSPSSILRASAEGTTSSTQPANYKFQCDSSYHVDSTSFKDNSLQIDNCQQTSQTTSISVPIAADVNNPTQVKILKQVAKSSFSQNEQTNSRKQNLQNNKPKQILSADETRHSIHRFQVPHVVSNSSNMESKLQLMKTSSSHASFQEHQIVCVDKTSHTQEVKPMQNTLTAPHTNQTQVCAQPSYMAHMQNVLNNQQAQQSSCQNNNMTNQVPVNITTGQPSVCSQASATPSYNVSSTAQPKRLISITDTNKITSNTTTCDGSKVWWCTLENCNKVATIACSQCFKATYCSETCQRSHWHSSHSRVCLGL